MTELEEGAVYEKEGDRIRVARVLGDRVEFVRLPDEVYGQNHNVAPKERFEEKLADWSLIEEP